MATNFSPCKGSYVLNQFPSNVMFGMIGFYVSASGAIQGHHGPLVFIGIQYTPANEVGGGILESVLSVCPQNLVRTTPPTVSVKFANFVTIPSIITELLPLI